MSLTCQWQPFTLNHDFGHNSAKKKPFNLNIWEMGSFNSQLSLKFVYIFWLLRHTKVTKWNSKDFQKGLLNTLLPSFYTIQRIKVKINNLNALNKHSPPHATHDLSLEPHQHNTLNTTTKEIFITPQTLEFCATQTGQYSG